MNISVYIVVIIGLLACVFGFKLGDHEHDHGDGHDHGLGHQHDHSVDNLHMHSHEVQNQEARAGKGEVLSSDFQNIDSAASNLAVDFSRFVTLSLENWLVIHLQSHACSAG